ncbi:whey acidic protein-like isoform X2 [Spea bombifrons]|uniref:whey acidic protein-like isoform X2 n=1 Tax=Spea bombifrons TaxID=233779 RepID=UPI00234AA5B2|nr:whey acidic protein-like isoform X2 [Spea bombifrons]
MISVHGSFVLVIVMSILDSDAITIDEPGYIVVDTSRCPLDVDYPRCGIDPVSGESECWTNRDCKRRQKCCFSGCRKRCLVPLKAKTGSCPPFNLSLCSHENYLPHECKDDEQCQGSSKCCKRCRYECTTMMALRSRK